MEFILCVLQYLLILIALAAVAGIGMFIGITLRKRSDAKKAESTEE